MPGIVIPEYPHGHPKNEDTAYERHVQEQLDDEQEARTMNAPNPPAVLGKDRRGFIGGSDIAAVLGLSPWRTALELWRDKTSEHAPAPASHTAARPLKRGLRWEAVVGEMLVEELERQGHQVEMVATNRRYVDKALAHFACEIDFEVRLDGEQEITNVELKTVHPFKASEWGESGTDTAPVHYVAQAMWGLGITGRSRCLIAALFGADEVKVFPVERDEATIAAMRERAARFWADHVLPGVAPAPVRLSDLDILHPKESEAGALLADAELTAKVLRLRAIDRDIKARTAEAELVEFEVKRAMGECSEVVVGGETVAITWKERAYSFLDQAALKEAHPKLVREFTRKASSRVFTLKPFAWKE